MKCGIGRGFAIGLLQLFERSHQDFGNEAAAVGSEVSGGIGLRGDHDEPSRAGFDEAPHFIVILDSGRRFETRAGVDAPGLGDADRLGDVRRVQAAGDDDFSLEPETLLQSNETPFDGPSSRIASL